MYARRNPPQEPPCDTCQVNLAEENEEAGQIYQMVRNQVIALGEQVIDLNFQAVKTVMDLYQIRDQRGVFDKVRHLFYHFLNEKRGEG